MKTRVGLCLVILAAAVAVSPLAVMADEGQVIVGGGQAGFGMDVDGDGDLDGSYFGIGAVLQDETATGHFVCGMWGNTETLKLLVMGVEGQITSAVFPAHTETILFKGMATVDLGKGPEELMKEVPFKVLVTPGGPGQGRIQLTVVGAFDGLLGDTILGNGDCDMPPETIASGHIALRPATPVDVINAEAGRMIGGGGLTTFGTDLDDDGDVDGAYFGLGLDLSEGQVKGHFVCAMWGNTEYLDLPLMAVEGIVDSASISSTTGEVFTFRGVGTVDLGKGASELITGVPFQVTAKTGGPGKGKLQLTVIGILDGVPGDLVLGNDNCDLPLETITSGLIALHAASLLPTAVEEVEAGRPTRFTLEQNAPNPFNPQTTIHYEVPETGEIRLGIFNLAGQEVRTLAQGNHQPGQYRVEWDGTDASGQAVASGVYLYRLEVKGRGVVETKRMALVR